VARIRTIKPDSAVSLSVQGVSIEARYFFQNLWCHLDDEGRIEWLPKKILADIFPSENDHYTIGHVRKWLAELESKDGMLRLYVVDGREYVCAPSWHQHQNINRPSPSKCPPIEDSLTTHGGLTEDSLQEKEREQGKGKGIIVDAISEWERFLSVYPKRSGDRGVAKGRDKFLSLLKSGKDPEPIISGVERYAKYCQARGIVGTEYVKQIPSFLSGSCWLEEFALPKEESRPQQVNRLPKLTREAS